MGTLDHATLRGFHEAFPAGAPELLDIERSFEARNLIGGTAKESVLSALGEIRQDLDREAQTLESALGANR